MTGGEKLYLLMVTASFVVFAVGLAYQSLLQSRTAADLPVRKPEAVPHGAAQHA